MGHCFTLFSLKSLDVTLNSFLHTGQVIGNSILSTSGISNLILNMSHSPSHNLEPQTSNLELSLRRYRGVAATLPPTTSTIVAPRRLIFSQIGNRKSNNENRESLNTIQAPARHCGNKKSLQGHFVTGAGVLSMLFTIISFFYTKRDHQEKSIMMIALDGPREA